MRGRRPQLMILRRCSHVLRRWRWVVVAGLVIGLVIGWATAHGSHDTSRYEATNTMLFDTGTKAGSPIQAVLRATQGPVPNRVADRLGADRRFVRSKVTAEFRPSARALLVKGRSSDPAQAEALANLTAEELIVELGGAQAPLRILEPAVAAPADTDDILGPTSRPGRAALLGAFGLLLGVGAAFVVERLDGRIRSQSSAEQALGVVVMADVPRVPGAGRHRVVRVAHPSPFIEAHRRLRTSLERSVGGAGSDDGGQVLVVTSPTGSEGKTVTVAYLAAAFAESGHSVLAISADLRRPLLHRYFDRDRAPGLVDVLRGAPDTRRLSDLNLATRVRGISLVTSGAPTGQPSALLEGIGEHLDAARGLVDVVLVDAPALLLSNDAVQLARHSDAVLLVVRSGRTSIGAARQSAELLERLGLPLVGAVLVGTDGSAGRS